MTNNSKLINTGFGNVVNLDRIISIVSPESAPIKRLVLSAKEEGKLIDATYGRKTRGVIVSDNGYIILIPLQPETVSNRVMNHFPMVKDKDTNEDKG